MTARKYDISIEQGATFLMTLTYKNAAGVPINLTGYGATMQVREAVAQRVFASASTGNGRITVNGSGQIAISVAASETAAIEVTRGVYDLFLQAPGGNPVEKLLYGDVIINPSVTR